MDRARFRQILRTQIYPITQCLALGPFASPTSAEDLRAAGITHILNVSEVACIVQPGDEFQEVSWCPVVDLERIPEEVARTCLDRLHTFVCAPASRVYVHCVAGRNRSPTVVWLYLVACGIDPGEAKHALTRRSLTASPAHPQLVDARL